MSNRAINQSGVPALPLAMPSKAPVFSTEDGPCENLVGGNSEQPTYPYYLRSICSNCGTHLAPNRIYSPRRRSARK